ncbi:PilZ domain-containing protein [Sphingomonas piscis]|uniref:PilZ domain-containing protein n=1 Tax=Sphingomonas piscis TaxID=2714943 RepID=UPI0019D01429|nr:PilZ domain-containing protein [Sphingomonas piscis]
MADPAQMENALESTTFSLTTAVPRPPERRADERLTPLLRIAKIKSNAGEQLMRIRNVSAGGLMAECSHLLEVGEAVKVEFSSQLIPSSIVWIRDGLIGVKFDQNLDLGELLAGRKPRHGFRTRPPRLEVNCKASVQVGKMYYTVDVQDISLAGLKVEPIDERCLDQKVVVVVESLRPIRGEVRWYSNRTAGILFDKPLAFEELAEWVGKRLELASLKAAYKRG